MKENNIKFVLLLCFIFVANNLFSQKWVSVKSNTNSNLWSVAFADKKTVFSVGTGGVLLQSIRGYQ